MEPQRISARSRAAAPAAAVALLVTVASAACGQDGPEAADARAGDGLPPVEAPADGGRLAEELDPLVRELFELELSPGLAIAVVAGDELAYARGFGHADVEEDRPATPETLFYIASTTKSFTALTAALLDHEGRLELDAPMSRDLAGFEFETALSADEISMRDLLTMTHGIEDGGPVVFRTAYSGEFTEEKLLELLAAYGPSESGRAFDYGNLGYNVAGIVMERATGDSWKTLMREEVLDPLGLRSTSPWMSRVERSRVASPYVPAPEGFERRPLTKDDANMHAAGGLVTSALDLSRWVEAFLNDGIVDGERVFPEEVVRSARSVQVPQDRDFSLFHRHGWGLGWDIGTYDGDTLVHRFGGYTGSRPHVSFMPEHGIGVVALVNEAALGGRLVDLVATRIYDRLRDKPGAEEAWAERVAETKDRAADARARLAEHLAERAARQRETPLPLDAYAGRYVNDALGTMEWRRTDEGLETRIGLVHGPAEVYDADAHAFRVELTGSGRVVTFRVEDGEVVGLEAAGEEFRKVGG